jgi:glycerol-3-phosphate cytidylyltransferase
MEIRPWKPIKYGFTCGAFDLIHPGHIRMLKWCWGHCDVLVVGVQKDPSVDRKTKNKPVQSWKDRIEMVKSIHYVNRVFPYTTEKDLLSLLKLLLKKKMIDVRFLGEDWKGKKFTGWELPIPVEFNPRKHSYSSSTMRELIYKKLSKEHK